MQSISKSRVVMYARANVYKLFDTPSKGGEKKVLLDAKCLEVLLVDCWTIFDCVNDKTQEMGIGDFSSIGMSVELFPLGYYNL